MAEVVEALSRRPRPTRTSDIGNMATTDPQAPPTLVPITTTTSVRILTRSRTTTIVNPASTITVVSVVPSVPSPHLVPDDSHLDSTAAFFKNTAAVAATFTVVGLAILGILAFCLIRSVRYHRARLEESQIQIEAARPARVLGDTDSEDAHRVAERRSAAGLIVPGEKRESQLRYSTMGQLTSMDMVIRGSMDKASMDEYYDATGARRTSMSGKRVSSSPSVAQAQREAMMLNARSYSAAADLGAGGSGANTLHQLPPEMMAYGGMPSHPPTSAHAAIRASTSLDAPRSSYSGAHPSAESDPQRIGFEARRPSVDYLENGLGFGHRSKSSQSGVGGFSDLSSSEAGVFSSSNRRPSLDQISTSSSSFAGHFPKRSSTAQLRDWTEGLKKERMSQGGGEGSAKGKSKDKGKQRESSMIEMTRRRSSGPQVQKVLHTPHGSLASAPGMMEALSIPLPVTTNSNPPTPISAPIARVPSFGTTTPLASPLPPYARSNSRGSITITPSPSQAQVQIQPPSNYISDSPRSLLRALSPPPASSRSGNNSPTAPKRPARRPSTAPSLLSVGESESKFRPSEKHVRHGRKGSISTAESGGSGGSEPPPPTQRSFVVMGRRPSTAPQATSPRMSIFGEPGPSMTAATTTTTSWATATPPLGDEVPNSPSKFRITNLADNEELDSSSNGHDVATIGAVDEPRPVSYDSRKASISSTIPTLSRASTFSRPSMGSRPSTSGTGTGTVDDEDVEDLYPTFGRALAPSPIPPLEINHPGPSRRPQLKARSSSTSSTASRPSTAPAPSLPTLTPAPKKRRPSTSTATSSTSATTVTARPLLRLDSGQVGIQQQQLNLISPAVTASTASTTTTPSPSPKPSPGLSAAASASTPTTATTATPLLAKGMEMVDYFSRRGSVGVADPSADPSTLLPESYSDPNTHPHANINAPPVLPLITGLGLQSIAESDAAPWFSNNTTTSPTQMDFRPLSPSLSPPTSPTPKRMGSKSPSGMKRGGSGSGSGSGHGRSSSGSQEGSGGGTGPMGGRASVSRASVDTTLSSLRDDHDYTPGRLGGLRVANA